MSLKNSVAFFFVEKVLLGKTTGCALPIISPFQNIIAALTGAEGRASKRSLLVRFSAYGPVPCSGTPGATGQGAGRSQRRDSRRRQSPGTLRIRSKTGGKRSLLAGLSAESAGCEALCASRPADDIRSVIVGREAARLQRRAEGLRNDNRKTMIKIKTTGQMLPFKSGTALPSPSPVPGYILILL
jgi:hypothetical protein